MVVLPILPQSPITISKWEQSSLTIKPESILNENESKRKPFYNLRPFDDYTAKYHFSNLV